MRPRPAWLLVLALIAVLLPIAFGQSLWQKDVLQIEFLQKIHLRERLLAGELPLWWRNVGLGRPFFSELQPGVLYPLNVILLLPVPLGLNLFTAAHLFILAFGMRRWLRRLEIDELPAVAGAGVVALSGYALSMFATNPAHLWSESWVPWILAAAVPRDGISRAAQAARVGLWTALALLAGEPQSLLFAYLLVGAQALAAGDRRQVRGALAVAAGAGLLALVLGAVYLLPGLEVASVGRPGGVALEEAAHFAVHPSRLVELVWPGAFGEPYSPGWFVRALVDEGSGKEYTPFATGIYLGLGAIVLGACALGRGRRRIDVALGIAALVLLGIALGPHAPVWPIFYRIPGASFFRYPEKYLFPFTICVGALTARGLQQVLAQPRRALSLAIGLAGLLAIGVLVATLRGAWLAQALVGRFYGLGPADAGHVLAVRGLHALVVSLALLACVGLAVRGRLTGTRLGAALTTFLLVDLLAGNLPVVDWAPAWIYTTRPPMADDVIALAGDDLAAQRLYRPLSLDFTGDGRSPGGKAWMTRATLTPDCGVELGIVHLDAYEIFHTARETRLWVALRPQPLRLLQLTSTRLALLGNGQLGPVHPGLDVKHAYPAIGASLVAVAGAVPLVYLAGHARPAATVDEAAAVVASPGFTVGRDAVVEGGEPRDALGRCTLDGLTAENVRIRCEASAPSYVIVNEGFFPGWRATVGGQAAPILAANVALRAVPIPAGASTIELRYRPGGLVAGAVLSLVGLVLALVLLRRRTR